MRRVGATADAGIDDEQWERGSVRVANVATVDFVVSTSEHEHGERVGFRDDFEPDEWILLRECVRDAVEHV